MVLCTFYDGKYANYVLKQNEHQGLLFFFKIVQYNTVTPTNEYLYEMHTCSRYYLGPFTVYPTNELDMYIKNLNSHKTKTKGEQLSPTTNPGVFPSNASLNPVLLSESSMAILPPPSTGSFSRPLSIDKVHSYPPDSLAQVALPGFWTSRKVQVQCTYKAG